MLRSVTEPVHVSYMTGNIYGKTVQTIGLVETTLVTQAVEVAVVVADQVVEAGVAMAEVVITSKIDGHPHHLP